MDLPPDLLNLDSDADSWFTNYNLSFPGIQGGDDFTSLQFPPGNGKGTDLRSMLADIMGSLGKNSNDSYAPPAPDRRYTNFDLFKVIYSGFLVVFGLLANLASILQCLFWSVFKTTESSSTHYVLSICIADTAVLFLVGKEWIIYVHSRAGHGNDVLCKTSTFCGYLGTFICPWFILAMTMERFMVVRRPLQRNTLVSVGRARVVILAIFGIGIVYNGWTLAHFHSEKISDRMTLCTVTTDMVGVFQMFQLSNLVFVFAVPCFLIFSFNMFIGFYLLKRRRRRLVQYLTPGASTTSAVDMRITRNLIAISTLYLLLNCPSYTWKITNYLLTIKAFRKRRIVTDALELLLLTQYSLHCFTYSRAIPALRHPIQATRGLISRTSKRMRPSIDRLHRTVTPSGNSSLTLTDRLHHRRKTDSTVTYDVSIGTRHPFIDRETVIYDLSNMGKRSYINKETVL